MEPLTAGLIAFVLALALNSGSTKSADKPADPPKQATMEQPVQ